MKIPLNPPFAPLGRGKRLPKGEVTPPFRKACLPVGRGGGEGFKKAIFYVILNLKSPGDEPKQILTRFTHCNTICTTNNEKR